MANKDEFERAAMEAAIGNAVDDTSNEIFGSAFGVEDTTLDETGDRSSEALGEGLEGQHELEDEDAEGEDADGEGESEEDGEADGQAPPAKKAGEEGDKDGEQPPKVPAEPEGRVPPGKHREALERARTAEAERDTLKTERETERASSRQEIAALNARLDGILTALKPGGQQKTEGDGKVETKPGIPDVFEVGSEAFTKSLIDQITADVVTPIRQDLANQRVENSMQNAHGRHGDTFTKAFEAVSKLNPQNSDDQVIVRRIYTAPNPGEALVTWHKRNETLREVGDDPAAFRERVSKETREALTKDPEFRKQLLAELRAEAEGDGTGRPNSIVKLPKSLNGATGTSRESFDPSIGDGSQQAIFDAGFAG